MTLSDFKNDMLRLELVDLYSKITPRQKLIMNYLTALNFISEIAERDRIAWYENTSDILDDIIDSRITALREAGIVK